MRFSRCLAPASHAAVVRAQTFKGFLITMYFDGPYTQRSRTAV